MTVDFYDLFRKPEPTARPPATVHPIDPSRATRYAAKALEEEAAGVAGAANGTRNHRLNKAAFNLGQLVAAGHLDHGDTWQALASAARNAGLEEHEIRATLASGLGAGQDHPRIVPEQPPVPAVTTFNTDALTDEQVEELSSAVRDRFPIIDWHDLWNTEDEDDDWIVEPIIPARRLVALFSAPKVGKSLLMLELAVNVARGTPTLGITLDKPRKVLYVDFENDPRGDVRERLRAMGAKPDELANLCYLSYPTLAKLDTHNGALELMAVVHEYECELVVIDTISRAVGGEENENDTWLAFYRNTGLAMKQAGVACIRLDHTGKDHDKGMRGGSAKYGDVDAVWKLSKVTDDVFQLDCTDTRMRIAEKQIVVRRQNNPLRHDVAAEGRMAAWDAQVNELIEAIDATGLPNNAGRPAIAEALRERGVKARDAVLGKAIKQRKQRLGYSVEETEI